MSNFPLFFFFGGIIMYLSHHGIEGQRWGVRNGPPYPLNDKHKTKQNLLNANGRNIEKWRTSKNNNVLYIIGGSGSGKSTTARNISGNNSVIHLDTLLEKQNQNTKFSNKEFEKYLESKNIDWKKAADTSIDKKDRWKVIDSINFHMV